MDAIELTNLATSYYMHDTQTGLHFMQTFVDDFTDASAARIATGTETDWSVDPNSAHSFLTLATANSGSVMERMRIDSSGNTRVTGDVVTGGASPSLVGRRSAHRSAAVMSATSQAQLTLRSHVSTSTGAIFEGVDDEISYKLISVNGNLQLSHSTNESHFAISTDGTILDSDSNTITISQNTERRLHISDHGSIDIVSSTNASTRITGGSLSLNAAMGNALIVASSSVEIQSGDGISIGSAAHDFNLHGADSINLHALDTVQLNGTSVVGVSVSDDIVVNAAGPLRLTSGDNFHIESETVSILSLSRIQISSDKALSTSSHEKSVAVTAASSIATYSEGEIALQSWMAETSLTSQSSSTMSSDGDLNLAADENIIMSSNSSSIHGNYQVDIASSDSAEITAFDSIAIHAGSNIDFISTQTKLQALENNMLMNSGDSIHVLAASAPILVSQEANMQALNGPVLISAQKQDMKIGSIDISAESNLAVVANGSTASVIAIACAVTVNTVAYQANAHEFFTMTASGQSTAFVSTDANLVATGRFKGLAAAQLLIQSSGNVNVMAAETASLVSDSVYLQSVDTDAHVTAEANHMYTATHGSLEVLSANSVTLEAIHGNVDLYTTGQIITSGQTGLRVSTADLTIQSAGALALTTNTSVLSFDTSDNIQVEGVQTDLHAAGFTRVFANSHVILGGQSDSLIESGTNMVLSADQIVLTSADIVTRSTHARFIARSNAYVEAQDRIWIDSGHEMFLESHGNISLGAVGLHLSGAGVALEAVASSLELQSALSTELRSVHGGLLLESELTSTIQSQTQILIQTDTNRTIRIDAASVLLNGSEQSVFTDTLQATSTGNVDVVGGQQTTLSSATTGNITLTSVGKSTAHSSVLAVNARNSVSLQSTTGNVDIVADKSCMLTSSGTIQFNSMSALNIAGSHFASNVESAGKILASTVHLSSMSELSIITPSFAGFAPTDVIVSGHMSTTMTVNSDVLVASTGHLHVLGGHIMVDSAISLTQTAGREFISHSNINTTIRAQTINVDSLQGGIFPARFQHRRSG